MPYRKHVEYLKNAAKNNMLSHAYIFYGPDEISKKETVYQFSAEILNGRNQKFHPDLFTVVPETDGEITINLVRQIKKFLVLSPHSAPYKIAVIESAEKLNGFAQNAMLKIFEEAPKHAVIILCVKTLDSLLETIISRAVKLPFWKRTVLPNAENDLTGTFENLLVSDLAERYLLIEKLNGYKPLKFFESWIFYLRQKFLKSPNGELFNILKTSQEIYFKLNETNLNPKFAFDELILNLK